MLHTVTALGAMASEWQWNDSGEAAESSIFNTYCLKKLWDGGHAPTALNHRGSSSFLAWGGGNTLHPSLTMYSYDFCTTPKITTRGM